MKTTLFTWIVGALALASFGTAQECSLDGDACSSSEACCNADAYGAICEEGSGVCCYESSEGAACSMDADCCGGTMCVDGVCGGLFVLRIPAGTVEGVDEDHELKLEIEQPGYGMSPDTIIVRKIIGETEDGHDAEVILDDDEDLDELVVDGETVAVTPAPVATSSERRLTEKTSAVPRSPFHGRHLQGSLDDVCQALENILCNLNVCQFADGIIGFFCELLRAITCVDSENFQENCRALLGANGDPHMTGFLGQKFDFSGQDGGWYALVHDDTINLNMQVTSPVPDLPIITYITGLGLTVKDAEGSLHTIEISVDDPKYLRPEGSCPEGESPCLADGALIVSLDGKRMTQPGEATLGEGVFVSAANIPGACRPFGFEKYWLEKQRIAEAGANQEVSRNLRAAFPTGEWILADRLQTNPAECKEYVQQAVQDGTLFDHQSEHTSFQITTPTMSFRINHGKIHQLAMRDPTDQFELPDHIAYQMNIVFETIDIGANPQGVLGETVRHRTDENGEYITTGPDVIPGDEEDYRVAGGLATGFVLDV